MVCATKSINDTIFFHQQLVLAVKIVGVVLTAFVLIMMTLILDAYDPSILFTTSAVIHVACFAVSNSCVCYF